MIPDAISSFAVWLEQLLAESTARREPVFSLLPVKTRGTPRCTAKTGFSSTWVSKG